MKEHQLNGIIAWFDSFVDSFRGESPEAQRNYDLKIDHTDRVRQVMDRLTLSLNLPPEERALATAIAICHDVGRFPQYRDYGTFNDATSTNHGILAVRTLRDEGVLDSLEHEERDVLLQAVARHNVFILPEGIPSVDRRFALLIRDADKLDIWRVLIEYFDSDPGERASAVLWELPDTGYCSPLALAEVVAGRMINRDLLATADDFKLLQLSWVYDLKFTESYRIPAERGYVETLAALLPPQPGCLEAVNAVRSFVGSRVDSCD